VGRGRYRGLENPGGDKIRTGWGVLIICHGGINLGKKGWGPQEGVAGGKIGKNRLG